jgi:branched-chain amino acid transport system permease protein
VLGSYALGLGGGEHIFYGAAIMLAVLLLPHGITGLLGGRRAQTTGKGH